MLKTSDFVPVIDGLAQEMNSLYGAYIYGYIYLNKKRDGTFDQSLQSIAKRASLARSTVAKWVKFLCDQNYLIDLTPDENHQPHVYQVTEKAVLEVKITFHKVSKNGGGVSEQRGGVSEQRTPIPPSSGHMNDVHDDDIWSIILDTWDAIGLDLSAINSASREFDNLAEFSTLLNQWLDALDGGHIPADWGYGLIYKKIKANEMPPTKPPTFGDEVKALMQMRTAGELEYWQDRQEKEQEHVISKIKKAKEIKIGDWFQGCEVVGFKDWGFAVDLYLDDKSVKFLESDTMVVVTVPEENPKTA